MKTNSVIYRFNDNRDGRLFLLYAQYILNIVIVYISSSKANNVEDLSLFCFCPFFLLKRFFVINSFNTV